ncbi:MAG TPA: hypothetical protein VFX92_03600 [Candidatus Krumholzibacteria bacterium]|nr:hypothetical protein [Candidatus Krumholzibacteria bacterium]
MGLISLGVDDGKWNENADVTGVITGAEALAMLAREAFDAVVLGPRVPDMPVSVIVDEVVRRYPLVPVILVADQARPGIWEHVPFADERLTAAIGRAAEVARLRRAATQSFRGNGTEFDETFRSGSIHDMERLMIFDRLNQLNQNRTRSAASLEISVRTLRNKLREYRASAAAGSTRKDG